MNNIMAEDEVRERSADRRTGPPSGVRSKPPSTGATGRGTGQALTVRGKSKTQNEKKIAEDEFMAAAIGDAEWLRQSLKGSRGSINFDKNGLAPIHLSAIHGRLECIKLLLEKFKVDVNLPSSTGWRPLHLCISNQTGKRAFTCLLFILDQGADPSIPNEDGITPMHQAASEGHVQCLKALIDVGASLDSKDYRGHKPIDLAKLWGHRKCARLLAAEQWHQDKEFLALEMNALQKMKIEQVVNDIEAEEANKAHQEFYGDLAFKEWLRQRGLKPRPTGPLSADSEESEAREQLKAPKGRLGNQRNLSSERFVEPKSAPHESLYRANSLQHRTQGDGGGGGGGVIDDGGPPRKLAALQEGSSFLTHKGPSVQPTETPQRTPSNREYSFVSQPPRTPGTRSSIDTMPLHEERQLDEAVPDEQPNIQKRGPFYIQTPWKKSTKVPLKDYTPVLQDYYPRDEYTMLPKFPPKRLSRSPTLIVADDGKTTTAGGKAATGGVERQRSVMPRLPQDLIKKTLEPGKYERSVVYKCKHIGDVHKRRHGDCEKLPRNEIGMHLTDDLESRLFRSGLLSEKLLLSSQCNPGLTVKSTSASGSCGDIRYKSSGSRRHNTSLLEVMNLMSNTNSCSVLKEDEYDQNLLPLTGF